MLPLVWQVMEQTQFKECEFQLGTELLVAGNIRVAVSHLQKAYHDSPLDFRIRYNYIVALCMNGQRKYALELAMDLPTQRPLFARGYALLGLVFEINEQFEEASRYYRAAHLLDPRDAKICAHLGRDKLLGEARRETQLLAKSISDEAERSLPELTALAIAGVLEDLEKSGDGQVTDRVLCGNPMVMDCFVGRKPAQKSPQRFECGLLDSKEIDVRDAAEIVSNAHSVVAITGAGISSPSGLCTRKELWQIFDRDRCGFGLAGSRGTSSTLERDQGIPWHRWTSAQRSTSCHAQHSKLERNRYPKC